MSIKDPQVYVEHMLACIAKIDSYTGSDKTTFMQSALVQDAVTRNLQTLAESSKRLPESLKDQHPTIPWRDISGFRNILVHDYLGLDLEIIWSVVEMELPPLKLALQKIKRG